MVHDALLAYFSFGSFARRFHSPGVDLRTPIYFCFPAHTRFPRRIPHPMIENFVASAGHYKAALYSSAYTRYFITTVVRVFIRALRPFLLYLTRGFPPAGRRDKSLLHCVRPVVTRVSPNGVTCNRGIRAGRESSRAASVNRRLGEGEG